MRSYLYRYTHILNLYKNRKLAEQETYDLFTETFYQIVDYVHLYIQLTSTKFDIETAYLHILILKCFTTKARLSIGTIKEYYQNVYDELKENEKIIKNYLA